MPSFLLCLFLYLQGCLTFSLWRPTTTVLGSLTGVPYGWIQGDKPSHNEILRLHAYLEQPALVDLEQFLIDVSTPGHPKYGRHLEKHEADDLLRPSEAKNAAVTSWLSTGGVPAEHITTQGHWLMFNISVSQAEKLLSTEFHQYHRGDITVIRTLQYSVPSTLRGLIASVQPTTRFGQPKAQAMTPRDMEDDTTAPNMPDDLASLITKYNESFCNTTMTPACIRGLYNFGDYAYDSKGKTVLAVAGFDGEGLYVPDVKDFLEATDNQINSFPLTVNSINHGVVVDSDSRTGINTTLEGNLDVQYTMALTRGTPIVYFSTGGKAPELPDLDQPTPAINGTNEPFMDLLTVLLKAKNSDLPDVLVISYGEDEQSVPPDYANQVCTVFAILGTRGVSVIVASGDTGVGSACESNDARAKIQFAPIFPASCPWVTSVGGTYAMKPEIAASFSSGGFSNYYPSPYYQLDTMKKYWAQLGDKNRGYYNTSGRGYPDVSAQAVRYLIYNRADPGFIYGTSCAAPTFGAIISNINNIRLAHGKAKLGFLNPWLYTNGSKAFNDITVGHSRGCAGTDIFTGQPAPKIDNASWDAIPGWDAVTGFGTPDFGKLKDMLT